MSNLSSPALPADLVRMLEDIGSRLSQGRTVGDLIGPMSHCLGAISPAAVARAEREISNAAKLWRWPDPAPGLMTLLGLRLSSRQQLERYDDLKYLFIFHGDGHLREAALRNIIDGLQTPFFVAAVAWRLNDWAEPVRQAAEDCARRVFPLTSDDVLARAACGLNLRQSSWARWRDEQEILREAFDRPGVSKRLAELLAVGTTGPLSRILAEALRGDALDLHLETIARTAVLPAVRASAFRVLLSGEAVWRDGSDWKWIDKSMGLRHRVATYGRRKVGRTNSPDQAMALAAGDRFVAVRKVAVDMLIRKPSLFGDRGAIADRLAQDPNASIRERATYVLEHP